jgi:hypothetical protein
MLSLPVITWVRFLGWLNLGFVIYWFYGRRHSPLADPREQASRGALEEAANGVTMLGYVLLFNGLAIALLGFMTVTGVTTEAMARWHEIGVTAEQADRFGLAVLGVALAITAAGWVLRRVVSSR